MKAVELEVKVRMAEREAEFWRTILTRKSCIDCLHYEHGCNLADGAEPPPEVKRTGCDSWEWDEIPFI